MGSRKKRQLVGAAVPPVREKGGRRAVLRYGSPAAAPPVLRLNFRRSAARNGDVNPFGAFGGCGEGSGGRCRASAQKTNSDGKISHLQRAFAIRLFARRKSGPANREQCVSHWNKSMRERPDGDMVREERQEKIVLRPVYL